MQNESAPQRSAYEGGRTNKVVLLGEPSTIFHSDSMAVGGDPNSGITNVLNWWVTAHTQSVFTWRPLPITRQPQDDTFSCGLLSRNALARQLLPQRYPLVDAHTLEDGRLEMMRDVLQRHLDSVSVVSYSHYKFLWKQTYLFPKRRFIFRLS